MHKKEENVLLIIIYKLLKVANTRVQAHKTNVDCIK